MNDPVKFWQGYDTWPHGNRGQLVYVYNPLFAEMRDTWPVRCNSMLKALSITGKASPRPIRIAL